MLGREAFAHLARHQGGAADIELIDRPSLDTTVLEVINDDMPFLLDSTLALLSERGIEPKLVAHPILNVEIDANGVLTGVRPSNGTGKRRSVIHIHLPLLMTRDEHRSLVEALTLTYRDIRLAVDDWAPMKERLAQAIIAYKTNPPPLDVAEIAEAVQFLEWIQADHFTFTGMRDYRFSGDAGTVSPETSSGLGILRDPSVRVLRRGAELVAITPEVLAFLKEPVALIITKANVKSRVHRRAHMDYIGVKLFDDKGHLSGELRITGLFTSSAYNSTVRSIPYIRHKVARVFERSGFSTESYSGRGLAHVMESYPRDELFQVDEDTLLKFSLDILQLSERPRIRALARLDRFDRFVSVMVYIPKDRYDTSIRMKVGEYLAHAYQGRLSAAYPAYPDGPLARTHYIIGRDEGQTPDITRDELEAAIAMIVRTWADGLKEALQSSKDLGSAAALYTRYGDAFSAAYREAFAPAESLADIARIERLSAERPRTVVFYRRAGDEATRASLKVFARGEPSPLSQRVPLLEDLGFTVINERTYRVTPAASDEGSRVWLHDMTLERHSGGPIEVDALKERVEALLMALFRGLAESDGYNGLVIEAGLAWREIAVIRAFSRYLRQIKFGLGQDYMWAALNRYPQIAAKLIKLFEARFDVHLPLDAAARAAREAEVSAAIDADLAGVASLDEDRILRRFRNLIQAAVRTNFYQIGPDGQARATIAFKFLSSKVEGLPLPRPQFEIFLYSPRVEGLHLRFGKVARGGIRWSDRPQDFRTEILGLVKAQQVKNAVIVPVGAKGGFVPKLLPPASNREAWLKEGTESYKIFIGTLLELTDNLDGAKVVPPQNTVRHDDDDPYLVVAADKGTATFSDTANAISIEKKHWLGDAFASGGSVGYDHKKMGITARGAWEAVKRHFREMDLDIQTTPFTVAGVGDMSGDVFGNGMLLSPAIRLVAAFDHRDIFIDPDPDAERSFAERQRIFDLPRSSWQDFHPSLISKGGGIFPRSAKELTLSPEIQALLDLKQEKATPQEVMNAILKARVDLLWFGGIGTYIRASTETDEQAGDRANDAIRITGADVRAKVIGEGANLGLTQLGRIEAARAGVRLNTDAIDNSAGVNTSDVEVNIKIALAQPEREGKLDSEARIALLASMTDEVGKLVLRNNYLQTLALSLSESRKLDDLPFQRRLMIALTKEGRLDRKVEYLPDDSTLNAREKTGDGLTRPELAVLLAYAKLALHDAILESDAPDDPYFERELMAYFPLALRRDYPAAITGHRLRREIVSTVLANSIVNRGGITVVPRAIGPNGGPDAAKLARSYIAVRDAFGTLEINRGIDALDTKIHGATQIALYAQVQDVTLELLAWFVRNEAFREGVEPVIHRFARGVEAIRTALSPQARALAAARRDALTAQGVPETLAAQIAELPLLANAPDIVKVADMTGKSEAAVTAVFLASEEALQFGALEAQAKSVRPADSFDAQARDMAVERITRAHRGLTLQILRSSGDYESWAAGAAEALGRTRSTVADILASGVSVSKLTIASGLLADLSGG
ncbi:MAG: NAD-glutamate dehydrogenase [Beijerinckiaceae bacterium]|nr:NAD-glutamate dehydrogenase [Beijerinckiaceae bacterium]